MWHGNSSHRGPAKWQKYNFLSFCVTLVVASQRNPWDSIEPLMLFINYLTMSFAVPLSIVRQLRMVVSRGQLGQPVRLLCQISHVFGMVKPQKQKITLLVYHYTSNLVKMEHVHVSLNYHLTKCHFFCIHSGLLMSHVPRPVLGVFYTPLRGAKKMCWGVWR